MFSIFPQSQFVQSAEIPSDVAVIDEAEGTANLEAGIAAASCVVIEVSATEYGACIEELSTRLVNGQTVVIVDAALGAALQFGHSLRQRRDDLQINIFETGRLSKSPTGQGNIFASEHKNVSVAGLTRNESRRALAVVSKIWSGLVPASNVLERGLMDAERLLKPALSLFYAMGTNLEGARALPSALMRLLMGLDQEIQQLSKAYKLVVPPFQQLLSDFCAYGFCSLEQQVLELNMQLSLSNRKDIPEALAAEIRETLILCEELARLARVQVPIIDSIIEFGSVISNEDLRKTGRNLHDLGLVGFDASEIIDIVNA